MKETEIILHGLILLYSIVSLISFIILFYILIKRHKRYKEIKSFTFQLGGEIDNDKVIEYINYISNIKIPERLICHNIIIAGYKLLDMNENLDDKLKKQLKILLLRKGIVI